MKGCRIYEKYLKRVFDFIFSLFALIILSPLILCLAFFVRVKLDSPVVFKQKRPGYQEKIFTLYKFRTMTNQMDSKGNLLSDEERLTKFGKFLRSTSLDELPELFNILKGDMSIVGPRPLLTRYLPYYTESERKRHSVRPGLTGLAQINGRNALSWDKRFELDIKYSETISFLQDLNIIFHTLKKVVKKEDILIGKEHILLDLDVERKGRDLE